MDAKLSGNFCLCFESANHLWYEGVQIPQAIRDIFQDKLAGNPLQLDAATRWQIAGKSRSISRSIRRRVERRERSEFLIKPILPMGLSDKVEHRQAVLLGACRLALDRAVVRKQ